MQENFEPNYKKAKPEEDDFFAVYSTSSSCNSDRDDRSSAMELDDEDKEYHVLSFSLSLFIYFTKQNKTKRCQYIKHA